MNHVVIYCKLCDNPMIKIRKNIYVCPMCGHVKMPIQAACDGYTCGPELHDTGCSLGGMWWFNNQD